ncbi:MAG: hypothetical protein MI919_14885 [Holophagales bacterium]|nr:hypothetical protein [Holophagales bacterium]
MPEMPDIVAYVEALERVAAGKELERVRVRSPFLVRSVSPPLGDTAGRRIQGFSRLGKRIVWHLEGELFLVVHLMITGRLRLRPAGAKVPGRRGLAAFDLGGGDGQGASILLTEESSKKRASLHVVAGARALAEHDPGGVEVLEVELDAFRAALGRENHTLKRALTDPSLVSGIGNAFSDEILLHAGLSPFKQTAKLGDDEWHRLFEACRSVLAEWIERTRREVGDGFPEKVTAFRDGMAVHGRYGQPCPVCGTAVQRLVYADNESNYCPTCQTGGRLLADRALSRLMRKDWPKTLEELEARKAGAP